MPLPEDKAVALYIAARIRELYPMTSSRRKAEGEWSLQGIADDLGVSKPQIAGVLGDGSGVGQKFERQFAAKFHDGDVTELRRTAAAWAMAEREVESPKRTVERPPMFANLEEVLKSHAWPEEIPVDVADAVVADVRREAFANGADRVHSVWDLRIRQLTRERMGRAKTVHVREPVASPDEGDTSELEAWKASRKAARKKR